MKTKHDEIRPNLPDGSALDKCIKTNDAWVISIFSAAAGRLGRAGFVAQAAAVHVQPNMNNL
jgi:hypothetical protein